MESMKRATLELNLSAKKTCKREFLEQMKRVIPWTELVANPKPVPSFEQYQASSTLEFEFCRPSLTNSGFH